MTRRYSYIDALKGLAICLVILGHLCFNTSYLSIIIYSFHMPLFFILSGILTSLNHSLNKPLKELISSKIKNIMYPYLSFSILAYIYYALINNKATTKLIIDETFKLFGYSTFWFLSTLFVSYLIFYLNQKLIKNEQTKFKIFLIIFVLTIIANYLFKGYNLNIYNNSNYINFFNRGIIGYIFISCGYYFFPLATEFITKHQKISIVILIILLGLSTLNGQIDLHYSILNHVIPYFILAISISFIIICLVKSFYKERRIPIFEYFGKNSLIIMATHLPFPITKTIMNITNVNSFHGLERYCNILICFITIIVIEYYIIEIIHRYLPFINKYPDTKKEN